MIKISSEKIKLLHQLMAEATGGSIRFYDPDGNLIEVGTPV